MDMFTAFHTDDMSLDIEWSAFTNSTLCIYDNPLSYLGARCAEDSFHHISCCFLTQIRLLKIKIKIEFRSRRFLRMRVGVGQICGTSGMSE